MTPVCSRTPLTTRGPVVPFAISARVVLVAIAAALFATGAPAYDAQRDSTALSDLSLEELMNLEITSASRRPQRLVDTASSAYVITQEDIKRSGLTSIPELLRMVPGLQVAHVDANTWAISCRGHNDDFANKLLVLIDGRSVYDQTFSGVFWDVQDYMLEDIDRIEIIRGPGASVWGANAVNGIVNIVTKSAADTQGAFATQLYGGEERAQTAVRFGGKLGPSADYRVYAKQTDHADFERIEGGEADDGFSQSRAGFRMDWQPSEDRSVTVSMDAYDGEGSRLSRRISDTSPYQTTVSAPVRVSGGNILTRWTRRFGQSGESSLQLYYDRTDRVHTTCTGKRDTLDLDYQTRLSGSGHHQVMWGLGARRTTSHYQSTPLAVFAPRVSDSIVSTFAQDEITLRPDRLRLTLGTKLEHNSFTGFEFQPNVRLLYTPSPDRALWAAASRAARTPSESEREVRFYCGSYDVGMPLHVYVVGNPDYQSEHLTSYEVGYRSQRDQKLSYDISGFYNHYSGLRSLDAGETYPDDSGAFLITPILSSNLATGRTYGAEVSATRLMTERWKLIAGLTLQHSDYFYPGGGHDQLQWRVVEENSPQSQFSLRSYLDLPNRTQLDVMLYYVDTYFRDAADAVESIPSSIRLDARFAFDLGRGAELVVGGRGLFSKPHMEYSDPTQIVPTKVGPTYYTKLAYSF